VLASILVLAAEASTTAVELLDQAAGDAKAVKNPILPTVNEMLWAAIFFIALWAMMKFVLLPRITKVMDGRTEKVRDDLAAAEAAEAEVAAARAAAAAEIADAKARARSELSGSITDIAVGAAEAVVQKPLDRAAQSRIVEDYVNSSGQN
jgi:F0F1-type ATP synthase membrane subunit b/b'